MKLKEQKDITVSFTGSTHQITDLIGLASVVLELDRDYHNDLPLSLWHLLQEIDSMLDLAVEGNVPYNPWVAQEWDRKSEDWQSVAMYCKSIQESLKKLITDDNP